MSWKQFAGLTLVIVALTALRFLVGEVAERLALIGLLLLGYFAVRGGRRRWRRRADLLRGSSEGEADAALARLTSDERAAMRIALGRIEIPETFAGESVQEFRYPRTPAMLREGTFWVSAAIALLAYVTLLAGWDREERWYALALGLGFTLSVGYQRVAWERELTTISMSSAGIEQRMSDGTIIAIPWREVVIVRNRPLLMRADIHGMKGRRILVGYTLIGFPRLMELAAAYVTHAREAAAGDRAR